MRVLVTGATGLVGSALVDLLASEHEVVALTRGDEPDGADRAVSWVRQDLARPLSGLPERIDCVVHLAQSERYRDFPDGAEDIFEVNVHSTARLLAYAQSAHAESFVLASTGGLYEPDAEPVTEASPISPPGPYFRSKLMAELLVADYGALMRTVVLRPFFIYGPRQSRRMLIARLAGQVLSGRTISIEGKRGLSINPIFVDDAARAFAAAATDRDATGVVNVAGNEPVDITTLVELIAELAEGEASLEYTQSESTGDLVADITRMREVLGVTPEVSLRDGIRALLQSLDRQRSDRGSPASASP